MSLETEIAAIKAFLTTITLAPVLTQGEAQKLGPGLPLSFTIMHLSRRFGGPVRGETRETNLRRLQTRVSSKVETNAMRIEDRIDTAFKHSTIDLGDSFAHFAYSGGGGNFKLDGDYYTALTDWNGAV